MLTPEFQYSSLLHAARASVHRHFAELEAVAPDRIAHRIVAFAWEATADKRYALLCDVLRLEVTAAVNCLEHPSVWRFSFRDDATGGELTAIGSSPAGPPREAHFVPTRPEHRARAFAHRWLWIWENLGDGSAFDELLADGALDVRFHGGEAIATRHAFLAEARRLGGGAGAAHNVLDSLGLDASGRHYAVTAQVSWRGESTGGTPLRAQSRLSWELVDGDGAYPRLERLRVELIEPIRAVVPEEAPGPSVPNAPSDDAESGGP